MKFVLSRTGAGALLLAAASAAALTGCATPSLDKVETDKLLIVDCLVPGQVRRLGALATGISARRLAKLPAYECEAVGGEYASPNASPAAALRLWLPFAQQGDPEAQTQVGELYERGIGSTPDYAAAVHWYEKAAAQKYARAQVNLGALYERGQGVQTDARRARDLFRQAGGLESLAAAPSIQLIDPPLVLATIKTRGMKPELTWRTARPPREVIGRVTAESTLSAITVNGTAVGFDSNGLFRTRLDLQGSSAPIRIVATDNTGKQAEAEFVIVRDDKQINFGQLLPPSKPAADLVNGDYHALIISNQNYQRWDKLDTPHTDARALKELLETRYGYKVTVLQDVTRRDILKALNDLRQRLTAKDSLLVYYAGHGEMDNVTQRGYWIPVDGDRKNIANWVSVVDVTDQLNAISARQVMVISDSCYSGTLSRSALPQVDNELAADARQAALRTMSNARARVALTSGGNEPVVDGGGGKHSMFARALLDVLRSVRDPIEARKLYDEVNARFLFRATQLKVQQRPSYAPIKYAGHEAGDFVLVPKLPL